MCVRGLVRVTVPAAVQTCVCVCVNVCGCSRSTQLYNLHTLTIQGIPTRTGFLATIHDREKEKGFLVMIQDRPSMPTISADPRATRHIRAFTLASVVATESSFDTEPQAPRQIGAFTSTLVEASSTPHQHRVFASSGVGGWGWELLRLCDRVTVRARLGS